MVDGNQSVFIQIAFRAALFNDYFEHRLKIIQFESDRQFLINEILYLPYEPKR